MSDPAGDQPKDPIEEFLDVAVFAPVGLVLHVMENFDDLVARGRRQLRFAQSVGQMALGGLSSASGASKSSAPNRGAEPASKAKRVATDKQPGRTKPAEQETARKPTKKAAAKKPASKAAKSTRTAKKSTASPKAKKKTGSASNSASNAPFDVTKLSAKDAIASIRSLADADSLRAVSAAEKQGANRVTVLRAAEARLSNLD